MKRALAALFAAALLSVSLGAPVAAQGEVPDPLGFRWVASSANTAKEIVQMNGNGWVIDGEVTANGSYNHLAAGKAPKELLSSGTWQADSLVSLDIIGTYGSLAAGTIVMEVTLFPEGGEPVPATLTMNCNLPPAQLSTELDEGFYLTMADTEFAPRIFEMVGGGTRAAGSTVFNILEEPPV